MRKFAGLYRGSCLLQCFVSSELEPTGSAPVYLYVLLVDHSGMLECWYGCMPC